MAETAWFAFGTVLLLLTAGVVALARVSARSLDVDESQTAGAQEQSRVPQGPPLLYNLALTHLLIGAIVLAIVWMTGVPLDVLGLSRSPDLFGGILLGVGVFALVEGMTLVAKHVGVAEPERLRRMLAPETRREWLLLLGLVLPAVAVSEELLFRGALIGGLAAGTSFSPWFFVVLSALAFGVSHTAQGWMGIGVTGALGFLLGACFVLTGDLLLLVVAHYLVDTFEFLLHEGIDLQWGQSL